MTLKEKYLYCKEHNIDFILKMDELEEINNEGKEIQSIDDLVMVHKTSYAPKGKIQTTYEAGGTLQKK